MPLHPSRAPPPSRSPLSRPQASSAPASSFCRLRRAMCWRATRRGLLSLWRVALSQAFRRDASRRQSVERAGTSAGGSNPRVVPLGGLALAHAFLVALLVFPATPGAEEATLHAEAEDAEAPGAPAQPVTQTEPEAAREERAASIDTEPEERYSLHYQATVATQWHPSFSALYSGRNSMQTAEEWATSVVTDLFAGARLWRGGEIYFQPELGGGRGLSSTLGVAAFPSGEVYRVGDPAPTLLVGRVFMREVIGLGGGNIRVEPGINQLAGTRD